MAIIEVDHLTKEYKLGQLGSVKDTVFNLFRKLAGKRPTAKESFKALNDVSFSIEPGEIVGIIGQNGAGKSTLLKHLAGITTPTSGGVQVRGSVAPLIEVGAGLHPELTGRENIFLNGAILGIKKQVIRDKIDDIISFAELEDFIDTPVKRFSSGMRVRLGFAIATSFEADILIIDEVLAVGDLAFQRKCFDKMEQMIKHRGSTVLLVSHNIRQVNRICSRVIVIDHGTIAFDGDADEGCNMFYKRSNDKVFNYTSNSLASNSRINTSGEMELIGVNLIDSQGNHIDSIMSGDPLRVEIKFKLNTKLESPEFIVGTHTTDFVYLTSATTAVLAERPDFEVGEHTIHCVISTFPLISGTYCIRFAVLSSNGRIAFAGENLNVFSVKESSKESKEVASQFRLINIPAEWVMPSGKPK